MLNRLVSSKIILIFANENNKQLEIMVKIAMYKKDNGALLVIWQNPKGSLVGEVFNNGVEKRGKWDMRVTFDYKDATEYRVCEYFGFDSNNPWWKRW